MLHPRILLLLKQGIIWRTAAAVILITTGCAPVQAETLYASGHFPPGHVYTESDLKALIGHSLADPSYLIGRFVFLGERNGVDVFSTFTQGLLKSDDIAFGQTLLAVRFFHNVPPNLRIGTEINATNAAPLTIKAVGRSTEGFLLVKTECWVAP
jgi:hypothetical protein